MLSVLWRAWARGHRALGIVFSLAVAGSLLGVLIWRADLDNLRDHLGAADLRILVGAAAFYFLNVWIQAFRWHFLIRHLGSPGPLSLFPPVTVGIMGNNLLPLRMGALLRAEYLRARFALRAPAVLTSVVVEGWLDGLVLALLFLPVLVALGMESGTVQALVASGGLAVAALVVVRLLMTERWRRWWAGRRLPRLPLPSSLGRPLASVGESFLSGLHSVRSWRVLCVAGALTAAAWLVRAAELYLVGQALHLDPAWADYLVLTAALSASGVAHISPGNTGPYEVVAAEVLVGLGVARDAATAYAIISHAVLFIPVTVIGLAFFIWHRLTAARVTEAAPAARQAPRAAAER